MCVLGKELERSYISENQPITGFRGWILKDNKLYSQMGIEWPKICEGNITRFIGDIPLGIYSFHNYNYNYNYYYNYYNYNYDYYYNYYNYNYNYYNYRVIGECKQWGDTAKHNLGYRSSFATPSLLLKLDDSPGRNQEFINKFNNKVDEVAKIYDCKTMTEFEYLSI